MTAYACGMAALWRVVLAAGVAAILSGCAEPGVFRDWTELAPSTAPSSPKAPATVSAAPSVTVPASPTPDPERERYPYLGTLLDDTCVPATRGQLNELETLAATPGVVSYTRGALVRADDPWWTVAVATQVNDNDQGVTRDDVDLVLWFVTNRPSLAEGHTLSMWSLNPDPDDAAADRAITCLSRVPTPPPDPPEGSRASYTGQLAPGATCVAVTPEMLKHLEAVGRVGGAITYPRGQMVRANKNWWTVAVATEVHPNKLGHTRANVPEVAYFITDAPSKETGGAFFALDSVEQDTAAAAARQCLG